ncbi:MAG: sulfatase-like hydrolase/transferase [Bryobacterales bacterium]|nr:sulfatase-like hydrolase/transferase [Bryobacterales bacterium]
MQRREFIGGAAASAPFVRRLHGQSRRPNLVFIIADDHAGYVMGADGNRLAETPNMDQLAREGTRFAAHYCQSPVCTPSRQCLLTGQLPHSAGVTTLRTALSEEKPTLADKFQSAGYRTATFGKMHFNQPGRPGLHGFQTAVTEDVLNQRWRAETKPKAIPPGVPGRGPWQPFRVPAREWLNARAEPFARLDFDMKASYQTRLVREYLQAHQAEPFALWVSFHEPHSPFDFPVEDWKHFDPNRFPVPRLGPEDGWQIPLIYRDLSDTEKQGIISAYYGATRFLDRSVGTVLDLLREHGLEENTLVVYTADHGYSLGQHGRFEKHCGYDPAMRVPLLMRWPGRIREGVVTELTEHVDLSATLLDLMGLDPFAIQHGESLRPYLSSAASDSARDWIFSELLENEECYARSKKWKYIYCSGKRERTDGYKIENPTPGRYQKLYDLEADPGEFTDVSAAQPEVVRDFQQKLLRRYRDTHPEAAAEPSAGSAADLLDYYVRPRDAAPVVA